MATTRQQKGASSETTSAMPSTEDVVNDVKATAGEAFGQAKEKVSQAAGQAQQKAKSQLADRKDQVADGIDSIAMALMKTGEELEGQDSGPVGNYVNKAASALSNISQHVRERDVDQLLHEVEGFARREPAIALGAAFAIGVIAARFLKSSNQRRYKAGGQYDSASNQYGSDPYASGNYGSAGRYGDRYGSGYSDGSTSTANTNYLTGSTSTSGMAEES